MTLFGHHVVSELKDLLNTKDFVISKVEARRGSPAFATMPDGTWDEDWATFKARYAKAHAKAMVKIIVFDSDATKALSLGTNAVRASLVPCEDEYQAVLKALTRIEGNISKGDFQDLYNRIDPTRTIDFSAMPQPTAGDADLAGFKAADGTIKAGEGAVKTVAKPIAAGAIVAAAAGIGIVYVGFKYGVPAAQQLGYLPKPQHQLAAANGDHDFDE